VLYNHHAIRFAGVGFRVRNKYRFAAEVLAATAVVMPVAVWALGEGRVVGVVTMIVAVIVIFRHTENIRRLVAGTESRFKA